MEDQWIADRACLRRLLSDHPDWRLADFAQVINHSISWVRKWRTILHGTPLDDEVVLRSSSRARKTPPPCLSARVMAAILDIRLNPPINLGRIPGPKAILYYLNQDPSLKDETLPRSTRTVYRVLKAALLIPDRPKPSRKSRDLPEPMTVWEFDFKDNPYAKPDPDGKKQHGIEILVTVDTGTSILLDLTASEQFVSETVLQTMVKILEKHGVPRKVRFDRDPRFVGSRQQGDVPSPFVRFWQCLGVEVEICDPMRPWDKGCVERLIRTLDEECLRRFFPTDLGQTTDALVTFEPHYNDERPHQGRACNNQPPRQAFPNLPPLPALPSTVNPQAWLTQMDGLHTTRLVGKDTRVSLGKQLSYLTNDLVGNRIGVRLDGHAKEWVFEHQGREVKRVAIKGLPKDEAIPVETFVELMATEAVAEGRKQRQRAVQHQRVFAPKPQWIGRMAQALQEALAKDAHNALEQQKAALESAAAMMHAKANDEIPF
jgi:hypothetical protein